MSSELLISWGCGEFGQHGLSHHCGDATLNEALNYIKSDNLTIPVAEKPLQVMCGSSYTLLLTDTGILYSWGNGCSGQLGNGKCERRVQPSLVALNLDDDIRGMSCGSRHSFVWTTNGSCYSFGNNFYAQLGYNFSKPDFKENQLQPILVEFFPNIKVVQVACGARHSMFLLHTGQVMAVGDNQFGQIGNDTTNDVVIPTVIEDISSITHIAAGNIHSLASDEEDSIFAWGYGKAIGCRTGLVSSPKKFMPALKETSSVLTLAAGDCHSMILYKCGVVFIWGNNYEGQLGLGKDIKYQTTPTLIPQNLLPWPVVHIACGETTTAAVTGKGELYMWGKNAGLILAEKAAHYFQYLPHHVMMNDLFVVKVSLGAWHASCIVRRSQKDVLENVVLTDTKHEFFGTSSVDVDNVLPEKEILTEKSLSIESNIEHTNNNSIASVSSNKESNPMLMEENCFDSDECIGEIANIENRLVLDATKDNDCVHWENTSTNKQECFQIASSCSSVAHNKANAGEEDTINLLERQQNSCSDVEENEESFNNSKVPLNVTNLSNDLCKEKLSMTVMENERLATKCQDMFVHTTSKGKNANLFERFESSLFYSGVEEDAKHCGECRNDENPVEDEKSKNKSSSEENHHRKSINETRKKDDFKTDINNVNDSYGSDIKEYGQSYNTIVTSKLPHSPQIQNREHSTFRTTKASRDHQKSNSLEKLTRSVCTAPSKNKSNQNSSQRSLGNDIWTTDAQSKLKKLLLYRPRTTVPVIDLTFQPLSKNSLSATVKPNFKAFKNAWKVSNLFKDQKSCVDDFPKVNHQERISMNRPRYSGKAIRKYPILNNNSPRITTAEIQEMSKTKNSEKSSRRSHSSGQLFPPICSRSNYKSLTNIFLDRTLN